MTKEKLDIFAEKKGYKTYLLSTVHNGERIKMQYTYYTKKEAVSLFKAHVKHISMSKTKNKKEKPLIIDNTIKVADIDGYKVPTGLVKTLNKIKAYIYRDTVLKEHLFDVGRISEARKKSPELSTALSHAEHKMLEHIIKECEKADCCYFRFVFI